MQTKIFFNNYYRDETCCLAYDPEKKQQNSEWVGRLLLGQRNWNSKGAALRPCW